MLRIAAATLRHRLTGFVGAFAALALGTAMVGVLALTLAATFGTPHPGPQRFRHAPAVVAPLGMVGTARGQITGVCAAESAVAVTIGAVLAAVATALAALTQHVSLAQLANGAPTVIPWPELTGTAALCALLAATTAWQAIRPAAPTR
ncbi:hypothetical protein AB0J52_39480 [Spirillospora sp. NPDC049652]